jgi:hypothetical protein
MPADIYLIQPPPGADHSPIKPAHIVLAGDSAGGGMCLALLQVIRDANLPLPAGAVLISPWCDLTHSFPSVHTNTDTVSGGFMLSVRIFAYTSLGHITTHWVIAPQAQYSMAATFANRICAHS